eukprot:CFRG6532T1
MQDSKNISFLEHAIMSEELMYALSVASMYPSSLKRSTTPDNNTGPNSTTFSNNIDHMVTGATSLMDSLPQHQQKNVLVARGVCDSQGNSMGNDNPQNTFNRFYNDMQGREANNGNDRAIGVERTREMLRIISYMPGEGVNNNWPHPQSGLVQPKSLPASVTDLASQKSVPMQQSYSTGGSPCAQITSSIYQNTNQTVIDQSSANNLTNAMHMKRSASLPIQKEANAPQNQNSQKYIDMISRTDSLECQSPPSSVAVNTLQPSSHDAGDNRSFPMPRSCGDVSLTTTSQQGIQFSPYEFGTEVQEPVNQQIKRQPSAMRSTLSAPSTPRFFQNATTQFPLSSSTSNAAGVGGGQFQPPVMQKSTYATANNDYTYNRTTTNLDRNLGSSSQQKQPQLSSVVASRQPTFPNSTLLGNQTSILSMLEYAHKTGSPRGDSGSSNLSHASPQSTYNPKEQLMHSTHRPIQTSRSTSYPESNMQDMDSWVYLSTPAASKNRYQSQQTDQQQFSSFPGGFGYPTSHFSAPTSMGVLSPNQYPYDRSRLSFPYMNTPNTNNFGVNTQNSSYTDEYNMASQTYSNLNSMGPTGRDNFRGFDNQYSGGSNVSAMVGTTSNSIKEAKTKPSGRGRAKSSGHRDAQCAHCGTRDTTTWRRQHGNLVCNACGLYYKTKGRVRPLTVQLGRRKAVKKSSKTVTK